MENHIVFENTPILNIIDEISIKATRNYNNSPYVGSNGSDTSFISQLGRVLSFKSIVPAYEVDFSEDENGEISVKEDSPPRIYQVLAEQYKKETGVLTSESNLDLNGNYLITGFDIVEDTGGNFTITWELTEVNPFNFTKQTFQVWGSAKKTKPKSKKNSKKSGGKLNSTTKSLLKSCNTLSASNKASKCVKYLQKFLQSLGYYKKYKVDGIFSTYTKTELKKLQKAKKLKTTGKWDKATIKYFQKKYKYP